MPTSPHLRSNMAIRSTPPITTLDALAEYATSIPCSKNPSNLLRDKP